MPEATTQTEVSIPEHHAKRTDIVSVDSSNFDKFVNEKMGIPDENSPESIAAKEFEVLEAKKEKEIAEKKAEEDPTHDADLPEGKKKGINERFSKLSAAKREAEDKASKAIAEAQATSQRLTQLEKEAQELRALKDKYEPVKKVQDKKPSPQQFTDIDEYSKALEEWSADNAIRGREVKEREQAFQRQKDATLKSWQDKQAEFKKTTEDYNDVVQKSNMQIHSACGDAIMESDAGPQILYYLASNPELVTKIQGMSVPRALVEVGKLEAKFGGEQSKPESGTRLSEISKAPAPITPIKSGSGVSSNKIGSDGEFHGTYEEWKKLRRAGKIT